MLLINITLALLLFSYYKSFLFLGVVFNALIFVGKIYEFSGFG